MILARLLLFLISLITALFGVYLNSYKILFMSILLLLIHNIVFSLENLRMRNVFLGFQCTMYIFLIGGLVPNYFRGEALNSEFSIQVNYHIVFTIYLSLLFVFLGQYVIENVVFKKSLLKKVDNFGVSDKFHVLLKGNIRSISRNLYYLLYAPFIFSIIEKVIFVQKMGYLSYYTDFQSQIPSIIRRAGNMTEICLFLFLATLPTKKESRIPLLLYIFYGVLAIGYGQRNHLALVLLIIIIYSLMRNNLNGEIWFGKRISTHGYRIAISYVLFCNISVHKIWN